MALTIGPGVTISTGVTLYGGSATSTIDATTLTVNNGMQTYLASTLFFYIEAKANEFKTDSPSVFYYVDSFGVQTKFDGCTLGAVTPSGPYFGITPSGGTITTGTYLTNATNTRIYYSLASNLIEGDLLSGSGTLDLETESGTEDLMA